MNRPTLRGLIATLLSVIWVVANAQTEEQLNDPFRQLNDSYNAPSDYRSASGAPGYKYWQQQADYKMDITLNDDNQSLSGSETITYTNNSPDTLTYLWVQLDQNRFETGSIEQQARNDSSEPSASFGTIRQVLAEKEFDGGHKITAVRGMDGQTLDYKIIQTMMRINLETPMATGDHYSFQVDWSFNILDSDRISDRYGFEYYPDDEQYVYTVAQFYPRMAAYTDFEGWQNKQYLGNGEFTLEFGDYEVSITAPADHVVAATGELSNADDVLTQEQRDRLERARTAKSPLLIVDADEANSKSKNPERRRTRTWSFKAQNVRDFAFASSRLFMWDAMGYQPPGTGETVLAMSFFAPRGATLWHKYSTQALIATMEGFGKYCIAYPYPVIQSIGGPGGMEYPMISFNGSVHPEVDDEGVETYTRNNKNFMVGIVVHEGGHNWFPMLINSDERQWTWFDEGMNTFFNGLVLQEWEDDWPTTRTDPQQIVDYMVSPGVVPIMTNPESIPQIGNNAYAKTAIGLNILRESIMQPDEFDHAMRQYCQRWIYKRATPSDFFRTMEDASSIDLDWFWRGWFYSTRTSDLAIDNVRHYNINTQDPDVEEAWRKEYEQSQPVPPLKKRAEDFEDKRADRYPELLDFYSEHDQYTVSNKQRNEYHKMLKDLEDWQKELLEVDDHIYLVDISNNGGLPMPVVLDVTFEDGEKEEMRLVAEIWRYSPEHVTKMLVTDRKIESIEVDPHRETPDTDLSNNHFPRVIDDGRFELKEGPNRNSRDLMKDMKEELKTDDEEEN